MPTFRARVRESRVREVTIEADTVANAAHFAQLREQRGSSDFAIEVEVIAQDGEPWVGMLGWHSMVRFTRALGHIFTSVDVKLLADRLRHQGYNPTSMDGGAGYGTVTFMLNKKPGEEEGIDCEALIAPREESNV